MVCLVTAGALAAPAQARRFDVIGGYGTIVQPGQGEIVLVGSRLTGPCSGDQEGHITFTTVTPGGYQVFPPDCTPSQPIGPGKSTWMTISRCSPPTGCEQEVIDYSILEQGKTTADRKAWDQAAFEYGNYSMLTAVPAFGCLILLSPAIVPCVIAVAGFGIYLHLESKRLEKLAHDPPDKSFRLIAPVRPSTVPPAASSPQVPPAAARALRVLFVHQARVAALEEALLHSIERSAGAAASEDADAPGWQQRQNVAARGFALAIAAEHDALPGLRADAGRALRAARFRVSVTRAQAVALQRRLRTQGLPAAVRKVISSLGDDPAELLKLTLAASPSALTVRIPDLYFDARLTRIDRAIATSMRSFADRQAPHT
jgi:hypothetical protein